MRVIFAALLLGLAGCVSAPVHVATDVETKSVPTSQAPGSATIFVYRGSSKVGAMWPFAVFVDDREIGSIRRERYLATNVAPGPHVIKVHCSGICDVPDIAVQANFSADRSYHFLTEPDMRFGFNQMAFSSTLLQVSPAYVAELQSTYSIGKPATN